MNRSNPLLPILRKLAIALALTLLWPTPTQAGEKVMVPLDGSRRFAPLWPGGHYEHGGEGGFPWLRVTTDGKAGAMFVANVRAFSPALNFTDKFLKIRVKIDDLRKLGGMEFRLSSDRFRSDYFSFSLPLFEDRDFNILRGGSWTTITLSFGSATKQGNPDRAAINSVGWYLVDKGGDTPLTAYWGGLSAIDEPDQGVVSFTFDDGYDEHLLAAKLMAKYGFPGTAYVIPNAVGQQGYMTLHQLVDIQERYQWDVAAHHERPFTEMSADELENTILGVQRYLIDNGFGGGALHLAYPLGKQDVDKVRPLVRKHFATARIASAGVETLPAGDPHLLRVFNVLATTTPEEIGDAARRARDNKEWLILMLHFLVDDASSDLEYSISQFEKLLAEVARSKVRVMTVSEVWQRCGGLGSAGATGERCRMEGGAAASPTQP